MVEFVRDSVIPDIILVRQKRHADHRGWFQETYRRSLFSTHGITDSFCQDNQSFSAEKGTLRGLHYQSAPHAQAKLVSCLAGRIFDVAVDIRTNSPTFGQHTTAILTASGGEQLYIPAGFAHGFCTMEPNCVIAYKTSAEYAPEAECGIAFNDPAIGVEWPFAEQDLILSERDCSLPKLQDITALNLGRQPQGAA